MWLRVILVASLSGPVYLAVRALLAGFGVGLMPNWVSLPNTLEWGSVVVPGAVLACVALEALVAVEGSAVGAGIGWGALLGVVNVPVSVLVALVLFDLESPSGPALVSLLSEWVGLLPTMIGRGWLVGGVTGSLLGALWGWLRMRERFVDSTPE